MTAFSRVTSIHMSPHQVYKARALAEETRNTAAQNALERVLDAIAWPMAAGAVVGVSAIPGVLVAVACTELSNPRKGIQK